MPVKSEIFIELLFLKDWSTVFDFLPSSTLSLCICLFRSENELAPEEAMIPFVD